MVSVEEKLMITLKYLREYRKMERTGGSAGIYFYKVPKKVEGGMRRLT